MQPTKFVDKPVPMEGFLPSHWWCLFTKQQVANGKHTLDQPIPPKGRMTLVVSPNASPEPDGTTLKTVAWTDHKNSYGERLYMVAFYRPKSWTPDLIPSDEFC